MGTRENSATGYAAKDALDGDIMDELIPFLHLKACEQILFRTLAVRIEWVLSQETP